MDKTLILENGSRYILSPINEKEFDIWCDNRKFNGARNFDRFKRKMGYVEISDFSPFLLKNSKIEISDGGAKFVFYQYQYALLDSEPKKKCTCDGIKEACSDCPKDDDLRELQVKQRQPINDGPYPKIDESIQF